ncbi:Zinc (Zn2)-Iron (Fe2) Permease [Phytophthora megakarya]|uniref:Zinc (Zn2)-Iron (Fe2) Permease n=1 Tax=Phytophthora megakarya TaxID=4795 RepID=A0A225WNQ4_9STRA|nr:Zinc (Zn2)-Iron (Fe2) Permease [Phytophthora megakarya]
MEGQTRLRLLLLGVTLLSIVLFSTADDVLPVTSTVRGQEPHKTDPVKPIADHGTHAHDHDYKHDHHQPIAKPKAGRFSPIIWGQALLATALVGAAPVLVLLVVPLGIGNQEKQQPLLRVFLSFAAGGLLGDALLHLLPHSLPEAHAHDHDHAHDHEGHGHSHSIADLSVWLWTLAGMLTFLMLDKFVRAQTGGGHGHSHGHSHSSAPVYGGDTSPVLNKATTARKRTLFKEGKDDAEVPDNEPVVSPETGKKQIAAAGYLNLAADFSHNFTDGLAIGATFLRGTGWTTTVAMLLHELPHEIGDFAILIQSGFTRREAMITQLLTAIGAMIGTVIGLLMESAGDSSSVWISPFTAGGFIYIACTSVMPELLEDCSLAQSLKEAAAMCAGIGLMTFIAMSE